ncbi:MAG: DNA polymerase II [gamma proteobacterium symbiont of Bathyaustriella thionipta]|nr:DNA polymerase II [gamma proteobacterium symbiont of Bathyaustriella thionipta]MCU7950025.1 DNA polymerase II [gamma proteobacterium symbiont of Bathyaustriella thionipta]MCU7952538.1 DNA polymerase II [gamma proteobacterium symbiont of Bathyaustriella thionipta]MCU7957975.1 DNA polymerase II [gamma proteobacterium symbiont of Bathyaustriella thionipta]MCU7968082.1 DNA polymerase II [gamma proteobacterium symbiont of Bathyaustriella thionipta]
MSNKEVSENKVSINAFLLTRQWRDTVKGIVLDFWFSSASGPVHVLIENQQAVFFIRLEDSQRVLDALTSIENCQIKPLKLKDFEHKPVAGVYFNSQQAVYQARERLQQLAIRHYEADVRPVERYLTERYLNGPVTIEINADDALTMKSSDKLLVNPLIKAQVNTQDNKPTLKIMSLDIETAYDSRELYSISLLCKQWHITLMKGEFVPNQQNIEFFSNESDLLLRFIDIVLQQDPDILIGWNVINFDLRFLQKKADQLKMSLTIGRGESLPVWRKAQTEQNHYFLLIPGRVVLDGIDTLKSATWNFPSFSLESVGQTLLGRGKLLETQEIEPQADKAKIKKNHDPLKNAKQIKRLFYTDQLALAAYNLEDCQLVWDIFEHTELILFAIERARLTGLEMDRIGGSVAAFDNLYLPRLHRKGFVAPNISDREESLSAPGGYVMNSKPGLYDSVLVLDYKSLYPSIICTFRVDPYARIKAEEPGSSDCIPGFNGVSFARDEFILPDIIQSLWHARDNAKKMHNTALSQAIKIIMNSFYGVLGTAGCRVHDARLTSSITLRGHELMKQTVLLIEAEGYDVIYGDTDSVFVSLGSQIEQSKADKIGCQLTEKINNYWQKSLQDEYQIESFLEMEYETHYQRFFMPTVRGSDKGSKKRYAGLIVNNNQSKITDKNNDRIVFKGLETVRTDWTTLARNVQQEIYHRIFHDLPYEDYLKTIVYRLKQGKFDEQLIYRKRLRQKLSDYKKNKPPHAQAALKAEAYAKKKGLSKRYQNGGWIEYVITIMGPEPVEYNEYTLDYEHYIEKQIAPVVDALLMVVGTSLEKIIQRQYELF